MERNLQFGPKTHQTRGDDRIQDDFANRGGGTSAATVIGGPKHGAPKPACPSSAWVLEFFGVTNGAL